MSATPPDHDAHLLVRAGTRVCALALAHVIEILRPLPVEPVGAASACVLGVSMLRGAPVAVVDLTALLSGARSEAVSRLVSLRLGDRRVALAVDAVLGVHRLERASLRALPPVLSDACEASVAWLGARDRDLLVVLDAAKLVPEAVWSALEAS